MIQNEFQRCPRPQFRFTSFPELEAAVRFLLAEEQPEIDLAIIGLSLTKTARRHLVEEILRFRCPGCPVIIAYPSDMIPQEKLAVVVGDRPFIEWVEEPLDVAELLGAAATLLSDGPIALTRPRDCSALRARAGRMLKKQLVKLRSDRLRVEQAIQELVGQAASHPEPSRSAITAWPASKRCPAAAGGPVGQLDAP